MKYKYTRWTAEEEEILAQAVKDNVSPARLSVRLQRAPASIKRRMRELGLSGTRSGPKRASQSSLQFRVNPIIQAERWLEACRSGSLRSVIDFYEENATLECACTGPAVYGGSSAIQEYWASKLRSTHPLKFSLEAMRNENDRIVVDYLSFEAKPVRMFLTFDDDGKIVSSECGPRICTAGGKQMNTRLNQS